MANNTNGLDDTKQYIFTGAGLAALAANTLSVVGTRQEDSSTPPLTIYVADAQLGSDIIPNSVRRPSQDNLRYVKLLKGDGTQCFLETGSDIKFLSGNSTTSMINGVATPSTLANGSFRAKIDGLYYDIPIYNLDKIKADNATHADSADSATQDGSGNNIVNTYLTKAAGVTNVKWDSTNKKLQKTINNSDSDIVTRATILGLDNSTAHFLRGDGNWANTLEGPLTLSTNSPQLNLGAYGGAYGTGGSAALWFNGTSGVTQTGEIADRLRSNKDFQAPKVYNAVFNDYAEYRTTIDLTPGHVVIDKDDGSLACTSARLQPGAQVISDTFGHAMGQTFEATTPIAVAGRVLVYPYRPRENYHAGMAVCSAPDGTVDIMTREEIRDYPDCIVGIVSEIPEYATWGSDNVKVNGRIWVRIK